MTPPSNPASPQSDFFNAVESDTSQRTIAELCNALYERELTLIAQQGPNQTSVLRRRIAGLSHHVRRTARFLAARAVPLELDEHNASWQARQAAKNPARNHDGEKNQQWFSEHAKVGLVVPIWVQEFDNEHIELDSIDRVQTENQTLHVNKFGWFDFSGTPVESPARYESKDHITLSLVKPSKAIMTAGCCGHTWNHKGRTSPRTVTLREILLVSTLNWRKFSEPQRFDNQ
ncbi:hypothetical protein [uncultured Alteromonas sp.]|jgi:hypothetical protein|uniref:hypothetical protein n=1 Tax=uncultured Alteromonas sp. TaxID=179113 RepID=UPI0025D78252|nr:hypothetical protein [uncultured Alteromonas sp.]